MDAQSPVRVRIAPDGSEATLIAGPGVGADMLAPDTLELLVRGSGVAVDAAVGAALREFASAYGDGSREVSTVIARAQSPIAGVDGSIRWPDGRDPTEHERTIDANDRVDYCAGRRYLHVAPGEPVATIIAPTPGTDGRDVRGMAIPAKPGRPCPLRPHRSVTADESGRLFAQDEGVVLVRGSEILVTDTLEIDGSVDLTTGHVDFPGSVAVRGGVCSRLSVRARGDLEVDGLVEVAHLECGGSLTARRGMAGDGRGTVCVGMNARVGYLEGVTGQIRGDLEVERDLLNCRLLIGGSLRCPTGAILGGTVAVTASLEAKVLGSGGCVPTTIHLGDAPLLGMAHAKLAKETAADAAHLKHLQDQEAQIRVMPRPSASDRERLTELSFDISTVRHRMQERELRMHQLHMARQSQRKVDLHIAGMIYAGVTLHIGASRLNFQDDAKGPLSIGWDEHRELVYRRGSSPPRPAAEIARIVAVAPGGAAA